MVQFYRHSLIIGDRSAASTAKASWVVVMYIHYMNNHTTRCESVTARLTKHCI